MGVLWPPMEQQAVSIVRYMSVIKKYWWVVALGVVLLLVLFWPNSKKVEEKIVENPVIVSQKDLYLPLELPKIQSVNWVAIDNIELPEMNKFKIQKQIIDEEKEIKIKEMLGINNENGYVDKENGVVGYTEEIKSLDQIPQKGIWDVDVLKNKLKKMTENINGVNDLEIVWTGTKYQKILYPRWIESTENEAQSVEIRGDYIVNDLRMTTYYGESIKGTFNREGKLLKLVLSLRPEILASEGEEKLINIDEASKSPISMYGVIDNAGIEEIGKVNITQVEIVWVYSNRINIIKPYYWLGGNTYSENRPTKISLLLRAGK